MTERRISPRIIRRGLLAAAALCTLSGTSTADPPSSRDYPATYSSRKAPWYDPYRLFTSDPKKTVAATPAAGPTIVKPVQSQPMPATHAPVIQAPVVGGASQAWKWYGYGTPMPGAAPYTPQGAEMPKSFFPDPIPSKGPAVAGPVIRIEPPPSLSPDVGPKLPSASTPFANDVEWKNSAAKLRQPDSEPPSPSTGSPLATLKPPVAVETTVTSEAPCFQPRTPAEAARGTRGNSKDINVVPAPGIVMPGAN